MFFCTQIVETNIRQRGVGNTNAVKLGRCIKELERIYGIKNGNNQHTERVSHNDKPTTQSDLAEQLDISKAQLNRYKSLTDLIPELQEAVQSGQITATTAMGFVKKLSLEEQKKLAEQIGGKDKVSGREVEQYIEEIKRLKEENEKLHDDNNGFIKILEYLKCVPRTQKVYILHKKSAVYTKYIVQY